MHNSYVMVLEGLYGAIFRDLTVLFPTDRKDLERDKSRLLSLVKDRGLSFYTIDLPAAGKHFDACLASGFLSPFKLPGFRKSGKGESGMPKLFSALLLKVFDCSGMLVEQPDIAAILALRQLFLAAKKVRITCDESRTWKTVQDFFRIERDMVPPSLDWLRDGLDFPSSETRFHLWDRVPAQRSDLDSGSGRNGELFIDERPAHRQDPMLLDTIQRTADIVSSSLGWFNPDEWGYKHGPGAVADLRGGDSKYTFPNWPAKLEAIFPMSFFAFANEGLWADAIHHNSEVVQGFSSHEPPAKLIAVPKTQKGPRLIASEPTAHQWCQQSLMSYLRDGVRRSAISESIHFRDQTHNQRFALQASKTQSHWTIDLSSASDCLSLWCVERMFRANKSLLTALHASRTRWLVNTIDKISPQFIKLKKFAPMGAATTFPIQTIVYTVVVVGTMLHVLNLQPSDSNIRRMARQVRVYGDDIIAPHSVGELVVEVLTYLGFEVNKAKTYGTGLFRESCGVDAYDGVDITPAYYLQPYDKSRPASVASIVECSNNFYMKGFWHTAAWLKSTLPHWIESSIPVVSTDSGAQGWRSVCGTDYSNLDKRWNDQLHRWEYRILSILSKVERSPHLGESSLLQYFTEAPDPSVHMDGWTSGVDSRPVTRNSYRWVPERDLG